MAVTTRNYAISEANPTNILAQLHDALTDLNWFEPQPYGYMTTFTNTAGTTLVDLANKRYLVTAANVSGNGKDAVFDVLRNAAGQIAAVTLVTGGEGYFVRGRINTNSVTGNVIVNVGDTSNLFAGMLVTKLAGGTGALPTNTMIAEVANSTHLVLDRAPTTALTNATLQFSDIARINATDIGGNVYTVNAVGALNSTTLTLSDVGNVYIGSRITGTNVSPLAAVTAVIGSNVTLSVANKGIVNNTVEVSDEIAITVTGVANAADLTGTVAVNALTITNVATNQNLFVGGELTITSVGGPQFLPSQTGRVIIASITGTGPYTITLRNRENTFKGFTASGDITFKVSSGAGENWFTLDRYTNPTLYAWGVSKIRNSNDRLGCTFWLFLVQLTGTQPTLYIRAMPGFNPATLSSQGVVNYDWFSAATATTIAAAGYQSIIGSMLNTPLTLRTRQSGIDPNFAVFSFLDGNTNRNPFFLSKYNTNYQPWSLNDVFLGNVYEIFQLVPYAVNDAAIAFRTRPNTMPRRLAESGYTTYGLSATASLHQPWFATVTGNRIQAAPAGRTTDISFYQRQDFDVQNGVQDTSKIYTSIPINPYYYPISYYLPNDFGMVEIPWTGAVTLDTITVSESEVWTVIQNATNQATFTTMAMVARTT